MGLTSQFQLLKTERGEDRYKRSDGSNLGIFWWEESYGLSESGGDLDFK